MFQSLFFEGMVLSTLLLWFIEGISLFVGYFCQFLRIVVHPGNCSYGDLHILVHKLNVFLDLLVALFVASSLRTGLGTFRRLRFFT